MPDKGAKFGTVETGGLRGSLRDRKKTRRRDDILNAARLLFAEKGIDGTTVAEIAAAVEVSTPTVFNYFGHKDGILIALLTEGTSMARGVHETAIPRTDADFATILTQIFTDISARTLDIAGKRIWRYAEAAMIRHPTTELSREYVHVDVELQRALSVRVGRYDIRLLSGEPADAARITQVFFDAWNPIFFTLICDDACTLDQHQAEIDAKFRPLAGMLFEPGFLRQPTLKTKDQT